MKRFLSIIAISIVLSGCSTSTPFVIQEEDKIWTLKGGTPVEVSYDNKLVEKTFSGDMYVVSAEVLIGGASDAIDKQLNKVNKEAKKKKMLAIGGSILGIAAMALAIFVKTKGIKLNFTANNK